MTSPILDPTLRLQIRRRFAASRERVFRAWTDPEALKQWFAVAEGYTTPIAEVDLRVGGRYRLGMKPPDSDQILIVGGEYREIRPPERLVFTWSWEGAPSNEPATLLTIEFREQGGATEVLLTHENFVDEAARDRHAGGWEGCLSGLTRLIENEEV